MSTPANQGTNCLIYPGNAAGASGALANGPAVSADEVQSEAQIHCDRWPTIPLDDSRQVAESIIKTIMMGDGEIDISFSYLP